MSIFRRRTKERHRLPEAVLTTPPAATKEYETILAEPMILKGPDFDGPDGDLIVHGKVLDCTINVRKLTISGTGEVSGKVTCHTLVVKGRIAGEIHVHQALFEEQSTMIGIVGYTGQVAMKPGARVVGPIVHEGTKDLEAPEFLAIAPTAKALLAPAVPQTLQPVPQKNGSSTSEFSDAAA